jgi:small multidrug resistance pump
MNKNKSISISNWTLLVFAVCLEITGVFGLRFSEGFSLLFPTTAALISFALALYLVSRVMETLPISVAYPVWAGGGTAGTAFLGIMLLGEEINTTKVMGVLFVILGVILINMTSNKTSGC